MNCRRVEELIPLYAGGDIDRRLTGEVEMHLENCTGCAKLAAEFEASSNWLAEATPELDEALLADMKRGVLRELQAEKPQPGWFELMNRTLGGILLRPAVAAALLLIVFSALTIWVFIGRKASSLPTEAKGPSEEHVAPAELASAPDTDRSLNTKSKDRRIHEGHSLAKASKLPRKKPRTFGRQAATQVADSSREVRSPSLLPVGSDRMLRIEIQTGDPSIRIIWFAPENDSQQTNP